MTIISSISLVEELVKSIIPIEDQGKYQFNLVSYSRKIVDGRVDEDYMENVRKISTHSVEEKYWHDLVYIHKYMTSMDEAGFSNVLKHSDDKNLHFSGEKNLFIPIIDFAPNIDIEKIDLKKFLKRYNYDSHKLTIFNSGNSYHGVLDKLMSQKEYFVWLKILKRQNFVDYKWLSIASNNFYSDYSQVLRTTWTRARPEPKFLKQISIQEELEEQFI